MRRIMSRRDVLVGKGVSRWFVSALICAASLFAATACGGSSNDRPSDCTEFEFFNERNKQCTPCPAVDPPDCPEGCGYEIHDRDNGCRAARCDPGCDLCEVGEQYSEEDGLCRACPGAPDCSSFDCEGALRIEGEFRAPCPPQSAYACGGCEHPEEGCVADDDGMCTDESD